MRGRKRERHTSISLRASVLVTAMVGVVVYATATFGMEMMINVQDGGLAAARETAIAESVSDDKYFPFRQAASRLNTTPTIQHCL